jgi:hypothetical protein
VSWSAREDKENQSVVEEGWSYVAAGEHLGGVIGADSKAKKDRELPGKHEFFILYSAFSRTKRLSRHLIKRSVPAGVPVGDCVDVDAQEGEHIDVQEWLQTYGASAG